MCRLRWLIGKEPLWYISMTASAVIAIITRFYVRGQCEPKYFEECDRVRPLTLRNLDIGSGLVAVMAFYFLWMAIFGKTLSAFWTVTTFIILYGLMVSMAIISSNFLRSLKEEFERQS